MHSSRSLKLSTTFKWLLAAGMVSTLVACGGDGGTEPVAPPPPKKTLTITGTAATGDAIAGSAVTVTCRSGTGTATSNADGTFTVTVSNATADAAGPCVLAVTTNGNTLRSIAAGDGSKANITPLTEMLVQYIATQSNAKDASPAQLVTNTGVQQVMSTPSLLTASVNQVVSVITKAVNDPTISVPTDFLNGTLVAATASNPNGGNSMDQVLDKLQAKGVVTATGGVAPTVAASIQQDAAAHTITGATGGT